MHTRTLKLEGLKDSSWRVPGLGDSQDSGHSNGRVNCFLRHRFPTSQRTLDNVTLPTQSRNPSQLYLPARAVSATVLCLCLTVYLPPLTAMGRVTRLTPMFTSRRHSRRLPTVSVAGWLSFPGLNSELTHLPASGGEVLGGGGRLWRRQHGRQTDRRLICQHAARALARGAPLRR